MSVLIDRRTVFKAGVSALGILGPAKLALGAPAPLVAKTASADQNAQYSSTKFNGGRSQVGVNALQWGGGYPFINLLKTAQTWSLNDGSGLPSPDTLDTDGYPIRITGGGVYTIFYVPSQSVRPGNYVITWSGNGALSLGMTNTKVSGSLSSTTGSGRYVFATSDSRFVLRIVGAGSPHITNIQVFHAADEAALNAGQVFGAKFKERLLEGKFGVIRFLGWQNGNTTNVTTWATRKPLTHYSYHAQELRANLYAGVTTNSGTAYSASLPGFRLVDKATVIVKFNASCNGSCTLNVNGTGARPILNQYAGQLSSATNSFPVGGTWQSLATLLYDENLGGWIKQGGDLSRGSSGLDNGCPPELMVRLCAEVGAHPYFVAPPYAVDPATDYMSSLASYCRSNGPAWMVPRFEGPNELWNNGPGFLSTGYAMAKAAAYGWGADFHNWYGKILSVLGQQISTVYGGDRTKYQVLCGVQTATGTSPGSTSSSDPRLSSVKYLAQVAPAQAPFTKTPASRWVTHVCCAQYFSPSDYGTANETQEAAAFAAASSDADRQAIASAYAATSNSGGGRFTIQQCALFYSNWKAWALRFGITHMCGYEGGYSPDYSGSGKTAVDILRSASKQAPVLSSLTTLNYNNFVGLSGGGFVAEYPSCFVLSGQTPSNNAWAVLEDIYHQPVPPQWAAIVAFNN